MPSISPLKYHQKTILILMLFFNTYSTKLIYSYAKKQVCVAHRGYNAQYLENSMEGILAAWKVGANAIEFDIRHTKDGTAILMHDPAVVRVARTRNSLSGECPKYAKIETLMWKELDQKCELKNGDPIPTLSKVLEEFKNKQTTLVVEFKDRPNQKTLEHLNQFEKEYPHKLLFISFSKEILNLIITQQKRYPYLAKIKKLFLNHTPQLPSAAYDGIGSTDFTKEMVQKIHNQGKLADIWTINEVSDMKKYFDLGVDFITTDYIEDCLKLE